MTALEKHDAAKKELYRQQNLQQSEQSKQMDALSKHYQTVMEFKTTKMAKKKEI
jgi:hypothetical protein